MNKDIIPSDFQPILWSANVKNLDLERDKIYVIHQVLMYGTLEQIKWLFRVYKKEEIKEVFLGNPLPVYTRPIFYLIKNIVLGLKEKKLNEKKYIKNIIGSFE